MLDATLPLDHQAESVARAWRERLDSAKNLDEVEQEEMKRNIGELRKIHDKVAELNPERDATRSIGSSVCSSSRSA